jgi:hypothetical protein
MVKSNSVGSALGFLADSGSDARGSHWAMASQIAHRLAAERAQTGLPSGICAGTYYHGKAPGEHGDRTTGPLTLPGRHATRNANWVLLLLITFTCFRVACAPLALLGCVRLYLQVGVVPMMKRSINARERTAIASR